MNGFFLEGWTCQGKRINIPQWAARAGFSFNEAWNLMKHNGCGIRSPNMRDSLRDCMDTYTSHAMAAKRMWEDSMRSGSGLTKRSRKRKLWTER